MKKRRTGKIIGISAAILVVILGAAFAYIMLVLPNIPVPDLKVENDPASVENGRYLANSVMVCMDCHSARDWNRFSGPIVEGTLGQGGEKFDQSAGFPGVFYAKNITPYNLDDWTDGEIYRAITSGVNNNREVIFPVMPYLNYGKMDSEDIYDVIAYIRTLPSLAYDVPASKADFPMNIIMHMMPKKPEPVKKPLLSDTASYGQYMVMASACFDCHTMFNDGKYDNSMAYAGGREFNLPFGIIRSANITPDKSTGIGNYTQQSFVSRFKAYDQTLNPLAQVGVKEFNSVMPWAMYAAMNENDLKAIYKYLSTIRPISNRVEKFTPLK